MWRNAKPRGFQARGSGVVVGGAGRLRDTLRHSHADHRPVHALTFDVEEWFHAHNLNVPRTGWSALPSRLDRPMDTILRLLDEHGTRATFFVLGWVAQRRPEIVRRIHEAGHEVASHGFAHEALSGMTRDRFRADVLQSRDCLAELTGRRVRGYRAPRYGVDSESHWALDELADLGFEYDSSIYPVRSPHGVYGVPDAPTEPYRVRPALMEFPLPVLRILGRRVPVATGAYLRLWPFAATRAAFRQYHRAGSPVVVNIHPWELDPDQPRCRVGFRARIAHYTHLATTERKLEMLLAAYSFAPLGAILDAIADPRSAPARGLIGTGARADVVVPTLDRTAASAGGSAARSESAKVPLS